QRIPLLPTPDWSERDYDIDADPLWTYSPEPQPFEQLYYYHTDHLGTPQELLDAEGNLAWSADYKAWGEAKAAISDAAKRAGISNPLRFQGQYFDHETGLHYNRHRYYDPQIGRFISKDPISLMGGLNIFAYAPNPVHWVDPQGLAANGQLGTYGTLTGRANRRDQLEAHELIRNEALEQMGCGAKTKKGNPKRHPDNPSIALDLPTHDNVHIIENDLAKQHLGVGVNEFQLDNNRPTKRQMDVWQGALRKSGVGASQARRLRKNSEKFLKDLCCCP
uniref:RHS repeat domain-containing protein n=1 Tax=Chitinilyticum litopenaei TaxID=1121276 RepID=UPI001B7FE24F